MDPIISDRTRVIDTLKRVVPLMKNSNNPEDELLKFASDNGLPEEMLGAVAKAVNTLKTQSIYAAAKTAEDRGRSFSTIDVPALLDKYAAMGIKPSKSTATVAKDFDDWILESDTNEVPLKMAKVASATNAESIIEGDIIELDDNYSAHLDLIKKANKELEDFVNEERKSYAVSPVVEAQPTLADYSQEDYLQLQSELNTRNHALEAKFAKFFSPANLDSNKVPFYEVEQDVIDLYPEEDDIRSTLTKIATNLIEHFNLGDYIVTIDTYTQQRPEWDHSIKFASFLAPSEPTQIVNDIFEYHKNNRILQFLDRPLLITKVAAKGGTPTKDMGDFVVNFANYKTWDELENYIVSTGFGPDATKEIIKRIKPSWNSYQEELASESKQKPVSNYRVSGDFARNFERDLKRDYKEQMAKNEQITKELLTNTYEGLSRMKEKGVAPFKYLHDIYWNHPVNKSKTQDSILNSMDKVRAEGIFNDLMFTDPVLSRLTDEEQNDLSDIYNAAKNLYPDISTNRVLLRTFLRQAAETNGIDLNAAKLLADTEAQKQKALGSKFVTDKKKL